VQIPGDARPLADAPFQTRVEFLRQVSHPQLMEPGEQCQKGGHA
jgi:hypothetical protein